MPSARTMTLPAAVTVVPADWGFEVLAVAVTTVALSALGALVGALWVVVAAGPTACAGDWAKACVVNTAQTEIKVSFTRQGFTRAPTGGA